MKKRDLVVIAIFLFICLVLFLLTAEKGLSRSFIIKNAECPIVWIIIFLFAIGLLMSLFMLKNTVKENEILERIQSHEQEILEGNISANVLSKSIIINHLRKFYTAEKFKWLKREKIEKEMNNYLEETLLFWPKWLEYISENLTVLGMLGTVYGMTETLISNSFGTDDMHSGVAYALGTTIIGLIGSFFLSILGKIIISQRIMQLKTIVLLLQLKILSFED